MTENEIKTEQKPIQKTTHPCECGCGTEVELNKRFVIGHNFKKNKSEEKSEIKTESTEQPKKEDPKPQQVKISISDIHEYDTTEVALFKTEDEKYIYLPIEFVALVNNETYSIIVRMPTGIFMPAFLVPGFVGIISPEQIHETSPEQEYEPEDSSKSKVTEDIESHTESVPKEVISEIEKRTSTDISQEKFNTQKVSVPEKKPGILERLRNKKKQDTVDNRVTGANLQNMLTSGV